MRQPFPKRPVPRGRTATLVVLGLTVAQLFVGAFAPDLDRFAGKAFGARLVAYPAMMLAVPAAYALARRRRGGRQALPWHAFALLMTPFLIDVTGNSLDLYDTVWWWDDANHAGNWFLLCLGAGLLLRRPLPGLPGWALVLLVGARRVVHVHPARHRARHRLHGHARRRGPRDAGRPRRRTAGGEKTVVRRPS